MFCGKSFSPTSHSRTRLLCFLTSFLPTHNDIQLPILDMNTRAPLHCRQPPSESKLEQYELRRQCIQATLTGNDSKSHLLQETADICEAYESSICFLEQTLDEYCHESLGKSTKEMYMRDKDQVLFRYAKHQRRGTVENNGPPPQAKEKAKEREEVEAEENIIHHHCKCKQRKCTHPNDDVEDQKVPIIVVANLVIWRLGGLLRHHTKPRDAPQLTRHFGQIVSSQRILEAETHTGLH